MLTVYLDAIEQISCLGTSPESLLAQPDNREHFWQSCGYADFSSRPFDLGAVCGQRTGAAARQMDTMTQYAVACAQLALDRWPTDEAVPREHRGVILGSAFGCTHSNENFLKTLVESGPRRTSPIVFRNTVSNAVAGHLAINFKIMGSNSVINSGMISGLQALAYGFEEVREGHCHQILSGACDHASQVVRDRYFKSAKTDRREPLPLLDGACMCVLHSTEERCRSGWQILGYGMGFLQVHDPGGGMQRIITRALNNAGLSYRQVDVCQLHSPHGELLFNAPPCSLEGKIARFTANFSKLPENENTALPYTMALQASLLSLPQGRVPDIFIQRPPDAQFPEEETNFVFGAVGSDGNTVVLVMRHNRSLQNENNRTEN